MEEKISNYLKGRKEPIDVDKKMPLLITKRWLSNGEETEHKTFNSITDLMKAIKDRRDKLSINSALGKFIVVKICQLNGVVIFDERGIKQKTKRADLF